MNCDRKASLLILGGRGRPIQEESKNKSKYNSKHSLTHTPIKTSNPNPKKANKQVSQTIQSDIRPFQSDIKFLFLNPIHSIPLV